MVVRGYVRILDPSGTSGVVSAHGNGLRETVDRSFYNYTGIPLQEQAQVQYDDAGVFPGLVGTGLPDGGCIVPGSLIWDGVTFDMPEQQRRTYWAVPTSN